MYKLFYVEDEPNLGKIVSETLEKQGFEVCWETDGSRVPGRFASFGPDLCVLDIMLPGIDGYTLCRQLHSRYPSVPVIFLTARTGTEDLVKGFEAGGSDYVKKPFSMEELIARIRNQLRLRNGFRPEPDAIPEEIPLGKFLFRPGLYELVSPTTTHRLSEKEMQILSLLLQHRNRLTDRRQMLLTVWGDDSYFNTRNLDVYIKKIRNILREDSRLEIQTIKGMGHLLLEK
ncbi:MAG: response regulator transcription factor [Bacteroidota bacterium]